MIDGYANLQIGYRNKMANRFEESNSILIESLKENAKKLNKAQTLAKSLEVLDSTKGLRPKY